MARNGSGAYSNPYPNFVSGTVISSTEVDANNSDVATALTQSIAVDGQSTVTGNIPMNAKKFTGVAAGSAATDSLNLTQAQAEAMIWCGTAGGSANAITLAPSPAITAYAAGQRFVWMASSTVNTGATTVAISGLSAIALQDNGAALVAGNHAASKMFMGILNTTSTMQIMQVQSSGTDPLIISSLTVNGASQLNGTLTAGINDTGYDVKFFGATSGAYMLWDESADDLKLVGAAGLTVAGDIDVDGTTNLDAVDIDGATQIDGTVTVGVNDTGYDVKLFGATSGAYMLWDESADDLKLVGAAGLTVAGGSVLTGVTTHGGNVVSDTDSTDDLGTTGVRWRALYVDAITATDQITATGFTGTLDGILGSGAAAAATVTTLNTSGAVIFNDAGADVDFRVEGDADPNLIFADASVDGVVLGGSVGTQFNSVAGAAKLTVIGSSASTAVLGNTLAAMQIVNTDQTANNTAGLHFSRADTDDTPNYIGSSIVAQFRETQATGQYPKTDLNFLTSTAANSAPSLKMTLTAAGLLGIGVAAPGHPLHVVGDGAITGHASIGVNAVASTRALTVAGATDGTGSSIIVGYNSSLAAKFSVRDDGYTSIGGGLLVTGATQLTGAVTVGVNDTGHDVKFFGATAGAYMLWDESTDDLTLIGGAKLGIGVAAPAYDLEVNDASDPTIRLYDVRGGTQPDVRISSQGSTGLGCIGTYSAKDFTLMSNSAERVRILSGGNVGVGISAPTSLLHLSANQPELTLSWAANYSGQILFQEGSTLTGAISMHSPSDTVNDVLTGDQQDGNMVLGTGSSGAAGEALVLVTNGVQRMNITSAGVVQPGADNAQNFGTASLRWGALYAVNGSIQTSDAREKTAVRSFSDAEITAAKLISKEIGIFQWLTAVDLKGADAARLHTGLTVQRAIEIMTEQGLDPMSYGFICYDEWEKSDTVPAAGDRYSFRYDQLNLFIARGIEARLAALEA